MMQMMTANDDMALKNVAKIKRNTIIITKIIFVITIDAILIDDWGDNDWCDYDWCGNDIMSRFSLTKKTI